MHVKYNVRLGIEDITWPRRDTKYLFECCKYFSWVSEVNKWNIFQHKKRNFVSQSGHVICYLSIYIKNNASKGAIFICNPNSGDLFTCEDIMFSRESSLGISLAFSCTTDEKHYFRSPLLICVHDCIPHFLLILIEFCGTRWIFRKTEPCPYTTSFPGSLILPPGVSDKLPDYRGPLPGVLNCQSSTWPDPTRLSPRSSQAVRWETLSV